MLVPFDEKLKDIALKIKDIAYKIGLIADYIIETKTVGNWKYEKWNSGKAEAWTIGKQTVSGATSQGTSTIGYDWSITATLPISFVTVEDVSGQGAPYQGVWGMISGWNHGGNTKSLTLYISGAYNNSTIKYSVRVLGTWK